MNVLFRGAAVAIVGLVLTACDDGVFDAEAAQGVIESTKLPLSGEQVLVTTEQVTCGEKKGLWIVDQLEGGGAIGRLTDAGRALQFGDDIRMGDHKFSLPYTQLSGAFDVRVQKMNSLTDESPEAKIADASLGVVVTHDCFAQPLRLLGVDRGDFSEDVSPRIRLRRRNGWAVDSILH
jgi:hypothetical protein